MKKAEMIAGMVLLLLSGLVIWSASQMPPSATFGPGAGFLPFWLGIGLLVGVAALVAGGLPSSGQNTQNSPT